MLAKGVASQRVYAYAFPSISLDVTLSMEVPTSLSKAKVGTGLTLADSAGKIGGRFRSGMAVWEASLVMAEFLTRHGGLSQVTEVKELMGVNGTSWNCWKEKSGVELGAGLCLPSIVASNLDAKMISTDGDDAVL